MATSIISTESTSLEAALAGVSVLAKQIGAFGAAIEAAAKVKFGDATADVVAADDFAEIVTQALDDFGVPGAGTALTVEGLIAALAPGAVPVLEAILAAAARGIGPAAPAQPDAAPEDGGYPAAASDARSRGR